MTAVAAPPLRPLAWLVGTPADRARFADMHQRFGSAPAYGLLMGGGNCLAATVYGWHVLLFVAFAIVTMVVGTPLHRRARTPEVAVAVTLALLELDAIVSVLVTGGADSPLLPLTLVPLFSQAVCFRPVVTVVATATAGALVVGVCAAATALPAVPGAPTHVQVVCYLVVLTSLAVTAHHLADSDSHARGTASLDPLTGLFNRRALSNHFVDTCARTGLGHAAVGLVMLDIDHFKAINDTYGHERGDQVLQEVARRLARSARVGDLVYRVGGEEFVVLTPGADAAAASLVAERLRGAVSSEQVCGLQLTVSAGVCSAPAEAADLTEMSRLADGALYAAKRDGRDRVVVAQGPPGA